MKQVFDYLRRPETIWKIIVWLVFLWIMWANMNNKWDNIDKRMDKIESIDIQSRLAKIETDLSWIRATLESKYK